MEPAEYRPDDVPSLGAGPGCRTRPQWSRPSIGRMTAYGGHVFGRLLRAAMEPAEYRPDDVGGQRGGALPARAAMEPAEYRPDDSPSQAAPSRRCWCRNGAGRVSAG